MKKIMAILMVLLVGAAIAIAGCTLPGAKTTTENPTAAATAEPGATTAPGVTTGPTTAPNTVADTLGALYGKGKFTWLEYTTTTTIPDSPVSIPPTTMKMEMLGQEMHEGKMMQHTRITVNGAANDVWSDPNPAGSSGSSNDPTSSTARLTKVGAESITIGGTTYACTKYTVTVTGSDGKSMDYTYWAAPLQAPAPVQYSFATEGMTSTTQLTGWG